MKLLDITNQLSLILPKYTDYFSNTVGITSITASGGTATIVTSAVHNLTTGAGVTLSDVQTQTFITAVSQDGLIFTFTTGTVHDLTYGWEDHTAITLGDFTDVDWNTSFVLKGVPDRNTFKIQSINTIPVLNTNDKLLEIRSDGISGRYAITVVDTTTFTITGDFDDGTYQGGTVSSGVRIAGAINFERAQAQYTKQSLTDFWMFVIMSDAETSKDRSALSDATATPTQGTDIRLRLVDGFSLYVFKNVTEDIAAEQAVDICRHDLLLPIMKSVFGTRFTSGLSTGQEFRTIPQGHGFASYDGAVYVHAYEFQMSMDLVETDTVEPQDTMAFHDIDFIQTVDTEDMTVTIPLDEEL